LQAEIPKPPAPKLPSAEEEPVPEIPVKKVEVRREPALDEETQKFIAQSLTDVDLFASYGLTQKAIGLLEAILRRAPRHTPTLEKLLDFVLVRAMIGGRRTRRATGTNPSRGRRHAQLRTIR